MKIDVPKLLVLAAMVAVTVFAVPADAQRQRRASARIGANCTGGIDALFDDLEIVPLSAAEVEALAYLREEEKLARDVYLTLAQRWQLPIFANIASAEQKHMDLVYRVIEVHGLVDPITDDAVGVFTDLDLASLFGELVASGESSLLDALNVGATIEDMDLADLYELLDLTDNDHLQIVAYNLAKGSRNHLRAFVRALAAQGATYEPHYLTQEQFDAVFEAATEQRVFYNADGEPVPACGAEVGGFGMRRGPGFGGQPHNEGGSGNGSCDGSGNSTGAGNGGGPGNGECDGSGAGGGNN
jgi:hypothetical protein